MIKQPLVSIIVPVYNAETFLEECIDSLIHQTYKNIEIICINDHSIDCSINILEEKKKIDARIKIYNVREEKKGPSIARNIGLDNANGEFIVFCDSDDFMMNQMIENMVNKIINDNSDIVICQHKNLYDNCTTKERKWRPMFLKVPEVIEFSKMYTKIFDFPLEPWGKLFRLSVLKSMKFNSDVDVGEDVPFIIEALLRVKRISFVTEFLYIYRIRHNSLCHKRNPINNGFIYKHKIIIKILKQYNVYQNLFFEYKKYFLKDTVFRLDKNNDLKRQLQLINSLLIENKFVIRNVNIYLIYFYKICYIFLPFGRNYLRNKIKEKFFALQNEKFLFKLLHYSDFI